MHPSLRTIASIIAIVLALTLAACSAVQAATSAPLAMPTASVIPSSAQSTSIAPTITPEATATPNVGAMRIFTSTPSQIEPPLVAALPLTVSLEQAFPLRLGAQWVYSITSITGMPTHLVTATGYLTQTVVDASTQNGMHVFRIWSEQDSSLTDFPHNEPIQYYVLSSRAAYWWDSDHPEPLIAARGRGGAEVLPWPLKVGQLFNPIGPSPRADGTYAWNVLSQGQVSTPAGRFNNCFHLRFRTNPDDSHDWFCPGTGFVRREYRHHGSIGDIVQVLVGYNYTTAPDKHLTYAAVKAARLRLSQNGHADPALAVEVAVTPTVWLDDCLGLPAATACHRKRTPGYLIEFEKDQQRYLFRTDEDGRLARLAWSSAPPLHDAFVQWRYNDGKQCKAAAIGADQIQFGVCGEALITTLQPPLSTKARGLSQAADFRQRYRSFVAHTVRGTLIFTGTGTARASGAEQRAIAEWAALRYTEAIDGYLSTGDGPKLSWHEQSASVCGYLWIYQDGLAVAWDCDKVKVIAEGALAPQELARFYKWIDSGKHWNIEHIPQQGDGQPDVTLNLPSNAASGSAIHQDTEGLMPFARAVYARMTAGASEKAKQQNPAVVQGRLTVQDGRVFAYRLHVPQDWAGKYAVREEDYGVYFDYDGNPQSWLFMIGVDTEAQWRDEQKQVGHGKQLLAKDGVNFVYNTPLANPYSGPQADEFQRMGVQVQAILDSLEVTFIH